MHWLQRFFQGRHGSDQLNIALLLFYLLLALLSAVPALFWLQYVGLAAAAWAIFRTFSRNLSARRRENEWFLRHARPLYVELPRRVRRLWRELRDREHRYFNCPHCRARLRIPKSRGALRVTCPKCKSTLNIQS